LRHHIHESAILLYFWHFILFFFIIFLTGKLIYLSELINEIIWYFPLGANGKIDLLRLSDIQRSCLGVTNAIVDVVIWAKISCLRLKRFLNQMFWNIRSFLFRIWKKSLIDLFYFLNMRWLNLFTFFHLIEHFLKVLRINILLLRHFCR